jgi:hypothetical protein
MAENYPGTAVPFETYALPALYDPIMLGPGSESLQNTAQLYTAVSETFDKAVADLRAVMAKSQAVHEGEAADAARQHIARVTSVGEVGAEQARLATYALQEQAAYYARARVDMQAAADRAATDVPPPAFGTRVSVNPQVYTVKEEGRTLAVDAANLYQGNSNHNLSYIFQPFEPPTVAAPSTSIDARTQAPAWPGGGPSSVGPASAGPSRAGSSPAVAGPVPGGTDTAAASGVGGSGGSGPAVVPVVGGRSAGTVSTTKGSIPVSAGSGASTLRPGGLPASTSGAASVPGPRAAAAGRTSPTGAPVVGDPTAIGSGWVPGRPWTTRPGATAPLPGTGSTGPLGGGGGADASGRPGSATEPRSSSGRTPASALEEPAARTTSSTRAPSSGQHTPFMPMTGASSRGQDTEHTRPPWLIEDDPEAIWMSGIPPHGPAVIELVEE